MNNLNEVKYYISYMAKKYFRETVPMCRSFRDKIPVLAVLAGFAALAISVALRAPSELSDDAEFIKFDLIGGQNNHILKRDGGFFLSDSHDVFFFF